METSMIEFEMKEAPRKRHNLSEKVSCPEEIERCITSLLEMAGAISGIHKNSATANITAFKYFFLQAP